MFGIRIAKLEDAEGILKIYGPFVLNSEITFEYKVPSVEEMRQRIKGILKILPWLVYEDVSGDIGGYAYAHLHGEREGYKWTAETAVYVAEGFRGQGIGLMMYEELLGILKTLGYCKVIAKMSANNIGSQKLHEKVGFSQCGLIQNLGFKLGKWIDVKFYEKDLCSFEDCPAVPKPFAN